MQWRVAWLIVLILSTALSLWRLAPPDRDVGGFSTANALQHLRFIAAETHPAGSPFHQQVRDYLIQQFRDLGYDVQTQDANVPLQFSRHQGPRIPISNILARKPGTTPGNKAVLLAAHYDSVRTGPGAADDGAAVCALLDVARVLASESHRNDIVFLISDGEELGMLGASEFVASHPWLTDIGVALNFEARGTSGPSIMFETSENNRWLIDLYARSAPHPACSSLSYDIYKRMPNDTDFTIFRDEGHLSGLNFAFIGNYENYHSPHDDVDHLDPRSLRHHGVQALALARELADLDLTAQRNTGNDVYFDLLSFAVARYPASWAPVIGLLVAAFSIGMIATALWRGVASVGGSIASLGILLAHLLLMFGIAWVIANLTRQVDLAPHANLVIAGYAAFSCAVGIALFELLHSRLRASNFRIAGLCVWLILAVFSGFSLRGGSYLTAFPLLFGSLALLVSIVFPDSLARPFGLMLMIPSVMLLAPIIYLAFLGLTIRAAPMLVVLVVLALWVVPPPATTARSEPTESPARPSQANPL